MNDFEKIDYVLKALYISTSEKGMLKILESLKNNNVEMTIQELSQIKDILEGYGYAVFQVEPRGADFRAAITNPGKEFVENNSFSQPGTSILNL